MAMSCRAERGKKVGKMCFLEAHGAGRVLDNLFQQADSVCIEKALLIPSIIRNSRGASDGKDATFRGEWQFEYGAWRLRSHRDGEIEYTASKDHRRGIFLLASGIRCT